MSFKGKMHRFFQIAKANGAYTFKYVDPEGEYDDVAFYDEDDFVEACYDWLEEFIVRIYNKNGTKLGTFYVNQMSEDYPIYDNTDNEWSNRIVDEWAKGFE